MQNETQIDNKMENKANTITETQDMMRSIKKCVNSIPRDKKNQAEAMLEEIIAGRLARLTYKINLYIQETLKITKRKPYPAKQLKT